MTNENVYQGLLRGSHTRALAPLALSLAPIRQPSPPSLFSPIFFTLHRPFTLSSFTTTPPLPPANFAYQLLLLRTSPGNTVSFVALSQYFTSSPRTPASSIHPQFSTWCSTFIISTTKHRIFLNTYATQYKHLHPEKQGLERDLLDSFEASNGRHQSLFLPLRKKHQRSTKTSTTCCCASAHHPHTFSRHSTRLQLAGINTIKGLSEYNTLFTIHLRCPESRNDSRLASIVRIFFKITYLCHIP